MGDFETEVIIVGCGIVGSTLALSLSKYGIQSCVIETFKENEFDLVPKCNTISSRSMEFFRFLGIAAEIRKAGLPSSFRPDVVYATSWTGLELERFRCRSSDEVLAGEGAHSYEFYWPTPEPKHHCAQLFLEPILRRHVIESKFCRTVFGATVTKVDDDSTRVSCEAQLSSGKTFKVSGKYLVACDGGKSSTRKQLNVPLNGKPKIAVVHSVYFRSSKLGSFWKYEPAWMYRFFNETKGVTDALLSINGKDLWLLHLQLNESEELNLQTELKRIFCEAIFDFEIISSTNWIARQLVAEKYRVGNIFLCGDSAHLWIPFGGFGMNAGIEDAMNLSWKLSAVLRNSHHYNLLDSYEIERMPIGQLVASSAVNFFRELVELMDMDKQKIEDDDEEGMRFRALLGKKIRQVNLKEFDAIGLNFDLSYTSSDIILSNDSIEVPEFDVGKYHENSNPGSRAPHFLIENGKCLFDEIYGKYALLGYSEDDFSKKLELKLKDAGIEFVFLKLDQRVQSKFKSAWTLVRPDGIICWSGVATPEELTDLLKRLKIKVLD